MNDKANDGTDEDDDCVMMMRGNGNQMNAFVGDQSMNKVKICPFGNLQFTTYISGQEEEEVDMSTSVC